METPDTFEEQQVTVATYTPTPYQELVWPVVESGPPVEGTFKETEFVTISADTEFVTDPMFPDFTEQLLSDEQQSFTQEQEFVSPIAEPAWTPSPEGYSGADFSPEDAPESQEGNGETSENQAVDSDEVNAPEHDDSQPNQAAYNLENVELEHETVPEQEDAQEQTQSEAPGFDEAALMQALEQSYEKGCTDTRAEVELYKRQLEESYTVLWEDMQTQLSESLHTNERRAVELAFQIAKRMVGSVVETQREYVVNVIRDALQAAGGAEITAIRVSPQDYEFLSLNGYGERVKIHGDVKLSFISDETVRAGCIVETASGQIDFDLDKAWSRMHGKVFQGPQS